jgi:NAD-dependent dihydropyrimidine dehydrogenase PreA subunit
MTDDVYKRLAQHLDKLPGGYPSTESGIELRILRRLFSEEEAAFAVHLSLIAEPAKVIAERVGMDVDEASELLETMAKKGLIYRRKREGVPVYAASQYVVGIWEYQVNTLDPELIRDMNEYIPHLFEPDVWREAPQLRTIPVSESITIEHEVLPHEQAEHIVRQREKIAVAPCICRREHKMIGEGCDKPEESCLVFDQGADYYVENGLGRYIEVDEALQILVRAEETGLVLQPSNSKHIANICCCCGCCCGIMLAFKRHPKPASLVSTPFRIAAEQDLCSGCGDCVIRCQMEALSMIEDVVATDLDRCIGCGLCVTTCPTDCLYLERKPIEEQPKVPTTLGRAYIQLARARGVR